MSNKKLKTNKGITLVALIITIVVLLILAAVAINAIMNTNIIGQAQGATQKYNQGGDHDKIRVAMTEYSIEKYENPDLTIADAMKAEDWCSDASYNEASKTLKLTTSEGKKYTVKEDGTIINGNFDYTVYSLDELKSAVLSAGDGAVIGIFGDITVNTSIGDGTSKSITLVGGDENASVNMDKGSSKGLSLTIESIKIKTNETTYVGFTPDTKIKYLNCTIENTYFTTAAQVEFENCTFNQTRADAYNIWTYSGDVTFTKCTFNCNGKSVLIYEENTSATNTVNLNECIFTAAAPANDGKAAIEVDSRFATYIVNVNNCTSTGFDAGSVSGNDLWNNKKGTKATIVVDGVTVVTPE